MAQPVYVVPPISDEEFLGLLFAAPFLGGLFWLAYQAAEVWTFHPVLRILVWLGAAAMVILGALRPVRVLYSLAVAAIGMVAIFLNAPDLLWKIFCATVFLLVWGAIAHHFEKQQMG